MQVVILCGGRGTRLGRESELRPKPMVAIGEYPVLWHILKYYESFGHKDFVLCLGYLGEVIKDYFLNYEIHQNDVTVELGHDSKTHRLSAHAEQQWRIVMANTGLETNTGGRVKRIRKYIDDDDFLLTYGDGVADIDLEALVRFHRSHGKLATVSAVHPPARFGELEMNGAVVKRFSEKPQTSAGLINGGYFVFRRAVFDRMAAWDDFSLEHDLLTQLADAGELMAYRHEGFWQCMDTVRELTILTNIWQSGQAPWKRW